MVRVRLWRTRFAVLVVFDRVALISQVAELLALLLEVSHQLLACHIPRLAAADSIGHHEDAMLLVQVKAVFVLFLDVADVAACPGLDVHES